MDKEIPNFKSGITRKMLGTGISRRSMVSKGECKLYLGKVAEVADNDRWVKLVVNGYLGGDFFWDLDSIELELEKLKHDIKQIQLRLEELSNETKTTL